MWLTSPGGIVSPALSSISITPWEISSLLSCSIHGLLVRRFLSHPTNIVDEALCESPYYAQSQFDSSVYPIPKICFPMHPLKLLINAMIERFHYSIPVFFSQTQTFTLTLLCQVPKIKYTHSSHIQKVHYLEGKTDKQKITMKFYTWNVKDLYRDRGKEKTIDLREEYSQYILCSIW